jgi:hypothetical protein
MKPKFYSKEYCLDQHLKFIIPFNSDCIDRFMGSLFSSKMTDNGHDD